MNDLSNLLWHVLHAEALNGAVEHVGVSQDRFERLCRGHVDKRLRQIAVALAKSFPAQAGNKDTQ